MNAPLRSRATFRCGFYYTTLTAILQTKEVTLRANVSDAFLNISTEEKYEYFLGKAVLSERHEYTERK